MREDWKAQEELGRRIRKARHMKELTQGELSKRTGIRQHTISSYERGCGGDMSVSRLVRIADTCDVSVDWLLGRESNDG